MIDNYLNMNLIFDFGNNDDFCGTVVKSSWGLAGKEIGSSHTNLFFDTYEYEIEFIDGTRDKYTVNLIADNKYTQVDDKGHQFQLIS